jgi:type II secretory pathway pseudopilin PulG
MSRLPSRRGFTLVEALILLGIAAILLGFTLTSVQKVREPA